LTDTGQGSVRETQSRTFGCEALVEIAATLIAANRTDEKRPAYTALLIGVLSVALRRHVSKAQRAVEPAQRDVRPMTSNGCCVLLVRPYRKSIDFRRCCRLAGKWCIDFAGRAFYVLHVSADSR
jgi:hypothetical protein